MALQLAGRLAQMEWHNYSSSLNVTSILRHIHDFFLPPNVRYSRLALFT